MPFPCHAVPLRLYNVSFTFVLHSAAVSDSHLPCRAHAMLWPCRSSQGHGTARPSRDGLWGYLHAFGFFRLPRGVPQRLLSETYQSSSQRYIPTTVNSGSSTLQKKDDLLNCWNSSSDISGYRADFHEGHGTVGAGLGRGMPCVNKRTAWQKNGMGTAWARHAMCESAFRGCCWFWKPWTQNSSKYGQLLEKDHVTAFGKYCVFSL